LAKISALSAKAKENAIVIIEEPNMETPKTKQVQGLLKALNASGSKALFVYPEYNNNLYLSLRNMPKVEGASLSDVNTYSIVNADVMVLTEGAAKFFLETAVEA
jgi:large subunit ribosomal protein L4